MSLRPRAGLVAVVVALGLLGGALAPQVAAALSFSARSSVTPSGSQFVGDSVGTTFALSVENSGTVQTIGAVRITRPTSFWSIVDCPSAPATWSTAMAPDSCTYLSPAGSAGNIAKKHAATFTFVATTAPAIANRTGSWNVTVSTADNFSNPSLTKQSGATGRGLATTAYSFEITDAVVAGSAAGIGDPCPAPNRQGPAGATGEIIIVCGTNHTNVAQKPKKAYSSLSGSFIAGHGAFSGGNVAAGATDVVLGNWSNVSLGGGLGSDHNLQARIGAYAGRLSPQTTLTGYNLSEVAPVASDDDYFTVDEDNLLIGSTVLYNDTDANGDSLNAVLDTGPSHDSSFTLSADGTFSYMPAANYNGTDTFTYHANDGTLDSNTATVTITVNPVDDAPVAVDDSGAAYAVNEDSTLTVAAPGFLGNDTDVEGDPLTVFYVNGAPNWTFQAFINTSGGGRLVVTADGAFSYTPQANFNGSDSFTYLEDDGSIFSNTATVSITVNPVNDAPSAVDDPYAANENTALSVTSAFGLLSNDSDIDGDVLHVGSVEGSAGNVGAATATTQGGSVTVNANGSLSYTPPADFTGSDTFTYKANDGAADSGSATVTFTVAAPVNHAPGLLSPRFIDGVENTPLSTSASGLANYAYDIDGDPLTFIVVTPPQHAKPGTFAVDATTGAWTYEPVTNFEGDDGFTWKVNDGLLDSIVGSYSIKISSSGGGGGGGGGCRTPTQLGPSFIC